MSLDLYVFFRRTDLPERPKWQAALDSLRTGVALDPAFNPNRHTCFVPCTCGGDETGFEFYIGDKAELAAGIAGLREDVQAFDGYADIVWHGEGKETVAATSAAAALAIATGGVLYDPQKSKQYSASGIAEFARQAVDQMRQHV
jgi:hypothetical protein